MWHDIVPHMRATPKKQPLPVTAPHSGRCAMWDRPYAILPVRVHVRAAANPLPTAPLDRWLDSKNVARTLDLAADAGRVVARDACRTSASHSSAPCAGLSVAEELAIATPCLNIPCGPPRTSPPASARPVQHRGRRACCWGCGTLGYGARGQPTLAACRAPREAGCALQLHGVSLHMGDPPYAVSRLSRDFALCSRAECVPDARSVAHAQDVHP